MLAALAFVWWPRGNYRAIQYYERGTIQDVIPASLGGSHGDAAGLSVGHQSSATTIWPASAGALPTRAKPALSLVLVPRTHTTPAGTPAPTWVFPFNQPKPPGLGDNQSLAVNTKDGSVVYDVAFAMVWADQKTVLNKNEAYAFASCKNCRTTAISFQIVLIVGHANVIVPQNIAGSVNYNCISCLTQALALQLVVTLPNVPGTAEQQDITALWSRVYAFSKTLGSLSFSEIQTRLVDYEKQMLAVINSYAPPKAAPSPTASTSVPPAPTNASSDLPNTVPTGTGSPSGAAPASDPAPTTAIAPSSGDPTTGHPAPASSAPTTVAATTTPVAAASS